MAPHKPMQFRIDDAQFVPWPQNPNFSARATAFKGVGEERGFSVYIDTDNADKMAADGWPVKCHLPDEKNPEFFCFIKVNVKYRDRRGEKISPPPKIILISSSGHQMITEDTVDMLDEIRIKQIDFIAQSYQYGVGDKTGITAYLKTAYITMDEDELDRKYANIEEEDA